jgi:1-acyl-sn-glycerol-3-phosphate acyltransferase
MKQKIALGLLKLFGWKIVGDVPQLAQAVLIVAPHTSSWDFPLGVLARAAINLRIRFIGKAPLFRPPFGFIFRWLGGFPVARSVSQDTVAFVVQMFRENPEFLFALSPEGTRKYTPHIRSGFYQIALQAGVPIVMVGFDFGRKEVQLRPPFMPTGDKKEDFEFILAYFRTVKAYYPEQGITDQTVD